jgi:uncharacterized glyoxalase superfamily protein PhnB
VSSQPDHPVNTGAVTASGHVPPIWSPRFGMLTDRFGIGWMVTVEAD